MATMNMSDWGWNPPECSCSSHPEECGCAHCHECRSHDWTEWAVYPECEGCLAQLSTWLSENTDYYELQRQYGRAA
jgi:hypothetical protein